MKRLLIAVAVTGLSSTSAVAAEQKPSKPYPQYWMSVATQNQSIPGMDAGMSGMLGMFGGGFGPRRELQLQLVAPQQTASPEAFHDIPPGQQMGKSLPLVTPTETSREIQREPAERPEKIEKPKLRMLIYWGCSAEVAKGQPKVLDTEKMSMEAFGRAMTNRGPAVQYPPAPRSGWTYAEWPNQVNNDKVPKDASLVGEQLLRGNYLSDIRFKLDSRRDFMAPLELTTSGEPAGSLQVGWKGIPTATGYLATAMAHNQKSGEMIIWSSSSVPEMGTGLMTYLSNGDVQRFLKERVLMGPDKTSCSIPKGIFKDADGTMLQFIAYGDELNLVHPPRPKDPKKPWSPEWAVKVRLKSTGMTTLMPGGEQPVKKGKSRTAPAEGADTTKDQAEPPSTGGGMMDGLKGMFGF